VAIARERFVAGPNAPAAARERAADFFSDIAVGEDAALLRLLVSEIVTEAVERAGSARRVLELRFERDDRRLHIEIACTGPEAPGGIAHELRRTILEEATAAWGADANAGGRLWFELDLPAVVTYGNGWARTSDLPTA
jgi:anti-sigma regulatory factor (Ser/Thr protein kinase)